MNSKIDKEGLIVSSLLAGAAIYFGLSKKGGQLEDLARTAVGRVIDDQVSGAKEAIGLPQPPRLLEKHTVRNKQRAKRRFKK
jgi:hypothetical protein